MLTAFERDAVNTPEARRKRRPLLRFARDDNGGPSGMSVLGLLYPSQVLAELADPLKYAVAHRSDQEPASIGDVLEWARAKVERALSSAHLPDPQGGDEDQRWYWAAPILLDEQRYGEATERWWGQTNLAALWALGAENAEVAEDDSNWGAHIQEARNFLGGRATSLGRRPADLSLVLAELALAGPGVTALRALARACGVAIGRIDDGIRNGAAGISWGFRSLFNTPEIMALVRSLSFEAFVNLPAPRSRRTILSFLRPREGELPYWHKVLQYCVVGCVQAVLDEYAHVLREYLGLLSKEPAEIGAGIAQAVNEALTLRTSALRLDDVRVGRSGSIDVTNDWTIRTHFAVRFGDELSEDGRQVTRKEQVKDAFNSPFWPFVLVTTAVGQEGLDFHCYSHAVVHWNLPANPVDLEQREGRVHRYKGHAIRKNVARRFGLQAIGEAAHDPWMDLFAAATRDRQEGATDLVPYWIYPVEGGACIERHVPALPLSRDVLRAETLRRALAVYRMAFGQVRQEDLVAYLLTHWSEEEGARIARELQINLEPPHA